MTPDSLNLIPFSQAIDSLSRALAQPKNEFLRDSVIQRFKFTYELAWKALKRYLEQEEGTENIDTKQRKDLFRIAAERGLILDPVKWFEYHRARNETVHTYQEAKAEAVYLIAATFVPTFLHPKLHFSDLAQVHTFGMRSAQTVE